MLTIFYSSSVQNYHTHSFLPTFYIVMLPPSINLYLCASSNVSSSCLPEKMHSNAGCICLTFVQCVFSNVSSNGLPERMHNHTGCICLTFLHCAFSNVSSNGQLERMHNQTWLHLFGFNPLCIFKCVLKLLGSVHA